MRTSAFVWVLLGVAFVAGLLAVCVRLAGRSRGVAAAGWAGLVVLAAYGLGFREAEWYWALPAGAMIGWLFTAWWDIVRDSIWPRLAPIVAPHRWDLAATRPPLSAAQRRDRTRVALSAAAGASGVGLMVICGFEGVCRNNVTGPSLAVYLVISLVVAWLSARFLEPIQDIAVSRTDRRQGAQPAADEPPSRGTGVVGRNPIQYSVLTFVILVLGDVGTDVLKHGLQAGGGAGLLIFLLNSLSAGVVTFYWAAAVSLRAPSVARRVTYTTTIIGALVASPVALVYALRVLGAVGLSAPGPTTQSQAVLGLLIAALVFVGLSIWFGLILFGFYAYGGGLALDRLRVTPVAWRVAAGLLPVSLCFMVFLLLILSLLRTLLAVKGLAVTIELPTSAWFAQPAMAVGWVLGLWADTRTEPTLNAGEPQRRSP